MSELSQTPKITLNKDLSRLSTMRVGGSAKYFVVLENHHQLSDIRRFILEKNIEDYYLIGEGSNTLFVKDYHGIVIKNEIPGIEMISESKTHEVYKVGAGVSWHGFVKFCVERSLSGNENLAYIPGTVGAAPVQNIAAYGQVQEDTFLELEAYDLKEGTFRTFKEPECEFDYRTSIFKKEFKNRFIITNVTYQLKKVEQYVPETSYYSRYESLEQFLPKDKTKITMVDIFEAVIALRKHKLPQVEDLGTLGSFFVNPFVPKDHLEVLKLKFPGLQYYPVDKMQYPALNDEVFKDAEVFKIPVGWLLEELGWRGKFVGNVGCSEKHALCIVVKGKASGQQVVDFMNLVKQDVLDQTGVALVSEVNII